tara:strand:- start:2395 stop:2787 length:393 start_codon:yes stop_codon:yes gene_type:complete
MLKKNPNPAGLKQDKNPIYYKKLIRFCHELAEFNVTPENFESLRLFIWNMNFFRDQVEQQGFQLATLKLANALVHLNSLERELGQDPTKSRAVTLVKQYEPELVQLTKQFSVKVSEDIPNKDKASKKPRM